MAESSTLRIQRQKGHFYARKSIQNEKICRCDRR